MAIQRRGVPQLLKDSCNEALPHATTNRRDLLGREPEESRPPPVDSFIFLINWDSGDSSLPSMEAEIDRLPIDIVAYIFFLLPSFEDLAQASGVCQKWRRAVQESLAGRKRLSFADQRMDDESMARFVRDSHNLKELNISRSCWACQITDEGLYRIASARCVGNLTSISLWGMAGITDSGVIHLVSRTYSLQHLNIGGTFLTDESLYAIANNCNNLKTIVLWSCRHVTESGLIALVNNCRKLESINVGGMRVPVDCFLGLLAISPALQLKSISQYLITGTRVS